MQELGADVSGFHGGAFVPASCAGAKIATGGLAKLLILRGFARDCQIWRGVVRAVRIEHRSIVPG
jgi:hypothetical protein